MIARGVLIANPASRLGARRLAEAEAALRSSGVACRVALTTHAGHEAALAAEGAAESDAVFVLGGDGTVMNVASALARTGVPVGILPAGTGNLLASELGIPRDVRRAVRALVSGATRQLDLGAVHGGRNFAFASGMGIDAAMVRRTTTTAKRRWGMLGYAIEAARAALRVESFRVTAEVDGRRVYDGPATLAMVVNGGSLLGGLFRFGPEVAPDDGVLDVCIYAPRSVRDTLAIIWRLLWRDYRPDPRLHFFRGQEIRLAAEPVQLFESDGELVSQSPVHISVVPRAATFLVPAARAASSLPRGGPGRDRPPARAISASNGTAYDSAVVRRYSFVRGGAA